MNVEPVHLATLGDLFLSLPIAILLAGAVATIVADLFFRRVDPPTLSVGAVAGAFVALWIAYARHSDAIQQGGADAYSGYLRLTEASFWAVNAVLVSTAIAVLVSPRFIRDRIVPRGEYYALLLFAAAAMCGLALSNELLILFLNIEILSIALYVLAGIERENLRSTEAAFKYFLMGSYSSAFLLFGITLVYGAAGTTALDDIGAALAGGGVAGREAFVAGGFALMFVGFGFKMTLAPFHMYAPDLYAGAPSPVAGFVATGSKAAALAAMLAVFRAIVRAEDFIPGLHYGFVAVAVASILVGNVGALTQTNIKRLLAYSGVAHAGYAMIPLAAALKAVGTPEAAAAMARAESAVGYYVVAYSLMTALAFAVVSTLGARGESHIDRYAGLARTHPGLAAALALALISLTGVPPTAGFVGKFRLFLAGVEGGLAPLAVFAGLASVASAYYYLRVVVKMYMEPASAPKGDGALDWRNIWAIMGGAAGVFLFAIFPMLIQE